MVRLETSIEYGYIISLSVATCDHRHRQHDMGSDIGGGRAICGHVQHFERFFGGGAIDVLIASVDRNCLTLSQVYHSKGH